MTSKVGKRPLRSLSAHEKMEAIRRVHDGESKASVARDIGVPESTLRGWCKNEDKILYLSRQSTPETDDSDHLPSREKKPRYDDITLQPYNLSVRGASNSPPPTNNIPNIPPEPSEPTPLEAEPIPAALNLTKQDSPKLTNIITSPNLSLSAAEKERERNRAELARLSVELGLNRPEMFVPNANLAANLSDLSALTANLGLVAQWNSALLQQVSSTSTNTTNTKKRTSSSAGLDTQVTTTVPTLNPPNISTNTNISTNIPNITTNIPNIASTIPNIATNIQNMATNIATNMATNVATNIPTNMSTNISTTAPTAHHNNNNNNIKHHKVKKPPQVVDTTSSVDDQVWYWLKTQQAMLGLVQQTQGSNNVDPNSSWFWKWYKQLAYSQQFQPQSTTTAEKPILYQQLTKDINLENQKTEETPKSTKTNTKVRAVLDNLLLNNNNNDESIINNVEDVTKVKIDDAVPTSASEALNHGEIFLKWLEKCGDPSVTAVQVLQFRYLLNNVRMGADRKNGAENMKTKVRSRK